MQETPQFATYTYTVPAGGFIELNRRGQFIVCQEASATFKIAFDDTPATTFRKGISYDADVPFLKVRIENPHGVALTLEVAIGLGGVRDNGVVISKPLQTEAVGAPVLNTPGAVVVPATGNAELLPSNPARVDALIRNLDTDGDIWVRDTPGNVSAGMLLQPSEALVLTSSAAVYAYNPNGAPVNVAIFETLRS